MSAQQTIPQIGELSREGVFILDSKTESFVYLNQPFADIFDISPQQLMDQPKLIIPFLHAEDNGYLLHCYQQLMKEQSIEVEFRLRFPDRTIRHLCLDAYRAAETGIITGFLKDITRNKQHEDYIVNYGAKKDTMLDMMTHNLSGPLHLTKNLLRWMQDTYTGEDAADIQKQLRFIQDNTQQCLDIINDFLKEEHLESERIYVKKSRFDVLERIIVTVDKLIETNKDKRFRLITDLQNLNITTDSVKFFQIIHNLVSNAIKFTRENGEIDIIVEETPDTFRIHVRDNGIGVPTALQPRLFDKRTAARREGLKNEFSTGLGLSIVKTLTELLDGKIWFTSDEKTGSTFSIELPKE